ncbi:MAG TPA: hypothetical protein PLS49_03435 [Candidatus Woesebacteria bacterium]|nr:hypothetical protein [Candidatus Woesebacteria bacterium]
MKRNIVLSIFALLTLLFVSSIQAQSLSLEEATATPSITTTTIEPLTQEERKEKREEFQTKLEEVKDIRKQAMIERIDEKINNFNGQHTKKLQIGLTRMQTVLDKISTKAATLNNAELDAEIETAQAAIDSAEEAILTQLEQEYIIDLTDLTSIRSAAQTIFAGFKTDLQAVHMTVTNAHMAVVTAARLLPASSEDITATDEANPIIPSPTDTESL